jgi:hypothetical protein
MSGADPQQGDRLPLDVFLSNAITFEMQLLDASQAPFRRNGRAWQQGSQFAVGAGFTAWEITNPISIPVPSASGPSVAQNLTVAIIDWFDYGGTSLLDYGVTGTSGFFTQSGAATVVPYVEDRSAQPNALKPNTPLQFQSINNAVSFLANGAYQHIGFAGATVAGVMQRVNLADVALFPGETFTAIQVTTATAGQLTIHGRFWDLGPDPGSFG